MPPPSFADRKAKILTGLNTPDDQYQDLSPKGSVDAGIRDLIAEINASPDYATTSSCAGRIAVYLEGSKGAKGGGKWLYTSHDPIAVPDRPGEVIRMLGLPERGDCSVPNDSVAARFVHFKFEPLILHILTSSLIPAQKVATAAMSAGFRESGINSVLPSSSPQHPLPATPIVAVRSSGLAFDCIIAYVEENVESGGAETTVKPMVTDEYLRILVGVANERFKTNAERTARFRKALLGTS
ncbi:hypothetical protein LTR62_001815 [Meristemomyces frigidus]|uniref:tRNA(Phe) 7-[(3-amino-3-carboxypropyl)-4-demethylwyosine(37)-N(4)]-methyltransferase n=1 Tax=Meristemomyces frigidus TaxID=1508187 RepID=A0AAN7TGF4_9PEZI|nr:hypothetical protein LTR62_001815 [Meristemomyces frigidus]